MENKKTLNIIALALAVILLAVLVVGHVQQNKSQVLELPADAQTLTASADGRNGPVAVEVIASPSEIIKVRVTEHGETEGIGTMAVDQLPNAIVEAQSLAVDAVSGASLTSEAIRNAVVNALESGGIDPAAFGYAAPSEPEESAPDEETVVEEKQDTQDEEITPTADNIAYIPGTYEAEATGMGNVKVSVTVDDHSIIDVVLDTSGETPEIGGAATEELTAQVMAAQGAEIDGVSGASLTSSAVRTAVADALAQAVSVNDAVVEPAAAGAVYVPGTYEAEATGMGNVKVSVTVDENSIVDVVLDTSGETPEIGGAATEELTAQVMAAQGAEIDGVSGASLTSGAVRTAVADALAQASSSDETGNEADESEENTVESEDKAATESVDDGVLRASAEGRNGPIEVEVVADESKIYSVKVVSHSETDGIGSVAVDELPAAIVEQQSLLVDGISGATVSSDAIRQAVRNALEAAGINTAVYEVVAAAAEAPAEDEIYEVDVVVVGAGGAGMTAAITAADAGKSVVVLESQGMVGGNSVRSTGGMNAAPTEWRNANDFGENAGVESTLAKVANYPDNTRIQELAAIVAEQWAAYQENPEGYFDTVELFQLDTLIGGGGINDPSLVKRLAENSADAIAWLDQLDPAVILHNVAQFGGASVKRIHRPVDENGKTLSVGAYVVPLLKSNLEARGIEVLTNTTATQIMTDENGAAIGVVAEKSDGAQVTVHANAVVITTGGFGANNDMIASIRPELDGFITTNAPGIQGQGIQMAQNIGADTVDLEQIQLHPTVHVQGSDAILITEGLRGDGAILVNQEGERFFDEVSTRDKVSAAEFEQTGGYAWLIVDSRMSDASNVIQGYISKGYAESGESFEALAEAIGAPADVLVATMEKWNACVEAKEDTDFGRVSFANPLDQAPYFAIKVQPGIHHTMGGIKINDNAEVINTEGNVIPGLFAAGEVTGGVHGNNRLGGNAVADFVIYGRIAGGSAAVYGGTAAADTNVEENHADEAEAISAGSSIYVPGTYEAQATGMGIVKVSVTVDENSIVDVVLDTSGETPEIGGAATEQLMSQVLAAQGAEIDGVSGASMTSGAVRTAVAEALAKAKAMAPNESTEEETKESENIAPVISDTIEEESVENAEAVEETQPKRQWLF